MHSPFGWRFRLNKALIAADFDFAILQQVVLISRSNHKAKIIGWGKV